MERSWSSATTRDAKAARSGIPSTSPSPSLPCPKLRRHSRSCFPSRRPGFGLLSRGTTFRVSPTPFSATSRRRGESLGAMPKRPGSSAPWLLEQTPSALPRLPEQSALAPAPTAAATAAATATTSALPPKGGSCLHPAPAAPPPARKRKRKRTKTKTKKKTTTAMTLAPAPTLALVLAPARAPVRLALGGRAPRGGYTTTTSSAADGKVAPCFVVRLLLGVGGVDGGGGGGGGGRGGAGGSGSGSGSGRGGGDKGAWYWHKNHTSLDRITTVRPQTRLKLLVGMDNVEVMR
ncbi:uncharacterized protein B0T23DRAFT_433794 [Neurospora hispaniola]|uniref:Uncharacterized protein n=1 Tax=Neurospora hispaniola TaxID=588809 RepID=A0AAJ0IEI6_9PEZI|nr:hypothetical protein B0T23DRAFT_433794 [Neurospora hispaniola]